MTEFMIKYGEKEHLEQIVRGTIRFAPSQTYIKLEELLHNKGQGDLLEGKFKIKVQSARMHDIESNDLVATLPSNSVITISVQDVNNMPVFCLSQYGKDDISDYINNSNYKISLDNEKIRGIQTDFPRATHALIILEPAKFINDINSIKGHQFVSDKVHYYDYSINSMEMLMYLTTGDETIKTNTETTMSMTYENRYRHLFCKDKSFSNQEEYRFIEIKELITEPAFYPITFTSKYLIVPIEQLKQPLQINI